MNERRKHRRLSATAFLNKRVHVAPLLPYFSNPVKGRLIDLSAGGMAILISELIPQDTLVDVKVAFPDATAIDAVAAVRHVLPRHRQYLHGIEFLTLSPATVDRINRMSSDYINCELRIQNGDREICRPDCAFFALCAKKEKAVPAANLADNLELNFKLLEKDPGSA